MHCLKQAAGLQLSGDSVSSNEAEDALKALRDGKASKGWLGGWRAPKDSKEVEARAQAKSEAKAAAKASREAKKAERLSSKARSHALSQSPPGETHSLEHLKDVKESVVRFEIWKPLLTCP